MDEILVDIVKEKIKRYLEFQETFNKDVGSELKATSSIIEKINSDVDTKEFIEKNNTFCLPPFKCEFIPYTFEIPTSAFDQSPYPSEIIKEVKIFISNAFYSESPEIEVRLFY